MIWPMVRLTEVCSSISDGTHQAPTWSTKGVPFLFVSNIRNRQISFETEKFVSISDYNDLTKNNPIEAGDVLYTAVGSYGNSAVVPPGKTFVFQRHIAHIKPHQSILDAGYLSQMLETPALRRQADSLARGIAQKTVTLSSLRDFQIPLPPLDEQRRIAAILDKADALRLKRKRALDLTLSARDHAFADAINRRNGSKTRRLGDALRFVTTGGRNWSAYYAESGKRFIRSLDVQMNKMAEADAVYVRAPENAEAKRAQTKKGDVLLTVTGSRIGRVAALPDELAGAYVSQHVAILRPDQQQVGATFLSMYLSSLVGQQQIAKWQYGQTKPGLNFEQIKMFEVPDISVGRQASIEVAMSSFNLLWDRQHEQVGALEVLFASLQHRAFSGLL